MFLTLLRKRICASAVLLFSASSAPLAFAQAHGFHDWSAPRVTVSTGYAKVRSNAPPQQCNCFGADGAYLSAAYAVRPWLRVAGEVTGSHANDIGSLGQNLTLVTYAVGPQIVAPAGRFEVFAQGMVGRAHGSDSYFPNGNTYSSSASSIAVNAGGGLDIGITRHIGVRAIDIEYLHTAMPNAQDNRQTHTVFATGLLFRFGHSDRGVGREMRQAYRQMAELNRQARSVKPRMPAAAGE